MKSVVIKDTETNEELFKTDLPADNSIPLSSMKTNDETLLIRAKTENEAKRICDIFHKLKLKWSDGRSFSDLTEWGHYKENTVYAPYLGKFYDLDWVQKQKMKIIPSTSILPPEKWYQKIIGYISRPWGQNDYVHPLLRIVPPFLFEAFAYLLVIVIIISFLLGRFS